MVSKIVDGFSWTTVQFMNACNLAGATKSNRAYAWVFAWVRLSRSLLSRKTLSCLSKSNALPLSIPSNTLRREDTFAYDHNAWFINNGGEQTGLCWSSWSETSWCADNRRISVSTTSYVLEGGILIFVGRTIPSALKPAILTKRIICKKCHTCVFIEQIYNGKHQSVKNVTHVCLLNKCMLQNRNGPFRFSETQFRRCES